MKRVHTGFAAALLVGAVAIPGGMLAARGVGASTYDTAVATDAATGDATPMLDPTAAPTPDPTATPTPAPTESATATPTPEPTPSANPTPASTPTPTRPPATVAPKPVATPRPTPVPTRKPATPAPTPRPTVPPVAPVLGGPIPMCSGVYQDVLSPFRGYGDWQRTLVDTIYEVPSSYYPPDLVASGLPGGGQIRSLVKGDLLAMSNDATAAGATLQVASAFRSYSSQVSTFNYWIRMDGQAYALTSSARPGHSEHQLGTAIDFMSYAGAEPWNVRDWATTKAGAWMAQNAWKYGFVMTYPRGKSPSTTCYVYEPWHYRYVGRTVAAAIHDSGLTSREYFWLQMGGSL